VRNLFSLLWGLPSNQKLFSGDFEWIHVLAADFPACGVSAFLFFSSLFWGSIPSAERLSLNSPHAPELNGVFSDEDRRAAVAPKQDCWSPASGYQEVIFFYAWFSQLFEGIFANAWKVADKLLLECRAGEQNQISWPSLPHLVSPSVSFRYAVRTSSPCLSFCQYVLIELCLIHHEYGFNLCHVSTIGEKNFHL
jgi:hypothetical protein